MYVASLQLGVGMAAQWSLANNATSGVALSLEGLGTPQGPHQTAARLLRCCLKSFINYRNEMQLCRVSDQSICSQESLYMHSVLFNSMQKKQKSSGSQDSISTDVEELHQRVGEQECERSEDYLLIRKRLIRAHKWSRQHVNKFYVLMPCLS